jgi:hypothetical protein
VDCCRPAARPRVDNDPMPCETRRKPSGLATGATPTSLPSNGAFACAVAPACSSTVSAHCQLPVLPVIRRPDAIHSSVSTRNKGTLDGLCLDRNLPPTTNADSPVNYLDLTSQMATLPELDSQTQVSVLPKPCSRSRLTGRLATHHDARCRSREEAGDPSHHGRHHGRIPTLGKYDVRE